METQRRVKFKSEICKISDLLVFILLLLSINTVNAQHQAAIASAHPLATNAGIEILKQGGNAFDAAIAVAATLAVVEPHNSGFGGGALILLKDNRNPKDIKNIFLDAREVAPIKATEDLYLDKTNNTIKSKLAKEGSLACAIPGLPKALVYLADNYGKLGLANDLFYAINYAKNGFAVDKKLSQAIVRRKSLILNSAPLKDLLWPNNQALQAGDLLVQKSLAKTLETFAYGKDQAFYTGDIAKSLVNTVNQGNGIWQEQDLLDYNIKIREPLCGKYQDLKITTANLPSAGGVTLINSLNILSQYEQDLLSTADQTHLIIESLRRSFCDRAKYLGDSDFVKIPLEHLISLEHANEHFDTIDINHATNSEDLPCGLGVVSGDNTTHFSIIDSQGNIVSATLTLNHWFGSGVYDSNTGIILNNQMDDFATKEGEINGFGLIGHKNNLIAPKKRPLSSMTPTIIENKNFIAALGSPGGSKIPSQVLLATLAASKNKEPKEWVATPRFHHQYLPDRVSFEPNAFSEQDQNALILRGHKLEPTTSYFGNMQVVYLDLATEELTAVADPRGSGLGAVIHK